MFALLGILIFITDLFIFAKYPPESFANIIPKQNYETFEFCYCICFLILLVISAILTSLPFVRLL